MADMLMGCLIGALWTTIVLTVVFSALRDDAPRETRIRYVLIDKDDYREWTYQKAMDVLLHVTSLRTSTDGPDDDGPDDEPDDLPEQNVIEMPVAAAIVVDAPAEPRRRAA